MTLPVIVLSLNHITEDLSLFICFSVTAKQLRKAKNVIRDST